MLETSKTVLETFGTSPAPEKASEAVADISMRIAMLQADIAALTGLKVLYQSIADTGTPIGGTGQKSAVSQARLTNNRLLGRGLPLSDAEVFEQAQANFAEAVGTSTRN